MQVVDVAFVVKKVLLLVSFDLNPAQALLRQIFRVVNIDNIVIFIIVTISIALFLVDTDLNWVTIFSNELDLASSSLLLQSNQLALRQVVKVDLALGLVVFLVVGSLAVNNVCAIVKLGQLVDLILNERVRPW